MVIVRLKGGMGNQMFQYALGRKISLSWNVTLKLDKKFFDIYKLHAYSLSPFMIEGTIASNKEIVRAKSHLGPGLKARWQNWWDAKKPVEKRYYIKENFFQFCPEVEHVSGNVYLDGYWQSEKYFRGIEEILKKDFCLKVKLDNKNNSIMRKIIASNSVSIHIRRVNYVTDKKTFSYHGLCKPQYYHKAVEIITSRVQNPHLYIFSDDIKWVRKNLRFGFNADFLEGNGIEKDYIDLMLMSNCNHNIIANSTFSWWAAWLNSNKKKIIIAPKKWFADPKVDTSDLISESWLRI